MSKEKERPFGNQKSLCSKCGWKTGLFTDTENSFMLVKSCLSEHYDNPEKENVVLEAENGLCPEAHRWRGREARLFSASYTTFPFQGCSGACLAKISLIPSSL